MGGVVRKRHSDDIIRVETRLKCTPEVRQKTFGVLLCGAAMLFHVNFWLFARKCVILHSNITY